MSVLTEAEIRVRLKAEDLDALEEYRVEEGTIVTPSAKAFLMDHKIDLIVGSKRVTSNPKSEKAYSKQEAPEPAPYSQRKSIPQEHVPATRYESESGGYFDVKPEHMTAVRGKLLVNKDHPVIRFRGRIDSLEARVLEVQLALNRLGMTETVNDLDEVRSHIHELLRCEVLETEFAESKLLGMDSDEIRARSHTPKKYYGVNHFAAGLEHGEAVILLNSLRTMSREVELDAYDAFKGANGVPSRSDIIKALNRLSSLFYVMMFRALTANGGLKPNE